MAQPVQQKRYNNYTLAIMASFAAALGVSIFFLLNMGLGLGLMSQALHDLLMVAYGVMISAQIVAGAGYVATTIDIIAERRTIFQINQPAPPIKHKKNGKSIPPLLVSRRAELVGLLTGLSLGVLYTGLLFLKGAGPLIFHNFPIIGPLVFLFANMGMMAGLFGRMGRVVDYFRKKGRARKLRTNKLFRGRNINYTLGVMAATVIGLVLAAVILGTAGVTSAMTFGGAIPAWAGAISFVFTMWGSTVSMSGYMGRKFDLWLGKRTIFQSEENNRFKPTSVRARANPETVGTVIGIVLGIVLATALVASGVAVSSGLFGLLLPFAGSTPVIYATFIAFCAGTCNRLGACLNEFFMGSTDAQHSTGETQPVANTDSGSERDTPMESMVEEGKPLISQPKEAAEEEWEKEYKELSQAQATQFSINRRPTRTPPANDELIPAPAVITGADLASARSGSQRPSRCF